MLNVVLYICLFLVLLTGLAITVMTLPGLWLMLAATAGYAWATQWRFVGPWTLLILLVLAISGEIVEVGFQGAGAKKAGAGKRGTWGALIGGILGGIFLSFIPIPIASTLAGVCIGTFVGALIGELSGGRNVGRSALIGVGAAKGRLLGTLAKVALGGFMIVIAMWMALPIGGKPKIASPTTMPSVSH